MPHRIAGGQEGGILDCDVDDAGHGVEKGDHCKIYPLFTAQRIVVKAVYRDGIDYVED